MSHLTYCFRVSVASCSRSGGVPLAAALVVSSLIGCGTDDGTEDPVADANEEANEDSGTTSAGEDSGTTSASDTDSSGSDGEGNGDGDGDGDGLEACNAEGGLGFGGDEHLGEPINYVAVASANPMPWTNPEAWIDQATGEPNGLYPGPGDTVVIEAGASRCINDHVAARQVTVNGELFAQSAGGESSLTTHYVNVSGPSARFAAGAAAEPFDGDFTLELIGSGAADEPFIVGDSGQNHKFLMAMNGGTIDLHGQERVSWTHLAGDQLYPAGTTELTLAEQVDWSAGDHIVLAPSVDLDSYEEVEIASVSGSQIILSSGLTHPHYGGATRDYRAYAGGPPLTLDQRAEVGLLSRNVRVIGDEASDEAGFGGHIMVMRGSNAHVRNAELYRLGQRGVLARYPIHWHRAGSTSGQYFENSAVHRSFNRAVTIHGTSDVRVEGTVAYDIPGHAYFLENGDEERNEFIRNLAIHFYRPNEADALLASDFSFNEPQNRSPSAFWITNPVNTFVGNVAAGSPGTGYWFSLRGNAFEFAGSGVYGTEKELTRFEGNVAHNLMNGIDVHDVIKCEGCLDDLQKNAGWHKVGDSNLIDRFTAYSTDTGVYSGTAGVKGYVSSNYTIEVRNSILADNNQATMFASHELVSDSVIIADSGAGLVPLNVGNRTVMVLYDGAARFERSNIIGFDTSSLPRTTFARSLGGASKNVNWQISGLTGTTPRIAWPDYAAWPAPSGDDWLFAQFEGNPRRWGTTIHDEDGSYAGGPDRTLIPNHPMLTVGNDQTAYTVAGSENVFVTDRHYCQLRVRYVGSYAGTGQQPDVVVTRIDSTGAIANVALDNQYKVGVGHQQPVIMRDPADGVDFRYRFDYANASPLKGITFELSDCMAVGQEVIVAVGGIGSYAGLTAEARSAVDAVLTPVPVPSVGSLSDLASSNGPAQFIDGSGDLYVKLVSQSVGAPQYLTSVSWN